jgi:hypothetical protein
MADDPISRLQFAQCEIDRVFGRNFAKENPELVSAVMMAASMDFAALAIARAIGDAATVLAEESDEEASQVLMPLRRGLVRE